MLKSVRTMCLPLYNPRHASFRRHLRSPLTTNNCRSARHSCTIACFNYSTDSSRSGLPSSDCLNGVSTGFYLRDAMLPRVLAVVVCLSVCLSHAGIVSKRLHGFLIAPLAHCCEEARVKQSRFCP